MEFFSSLKKLFLGQMEKPFIQISAADALTVTKSLENGKLVFFKKTDAPIDGKEPYSILLERKIQEKYGQHVSVTQGEKSQAKRVTVYMKCKEHSESVTCWMFKESFKAGTDMKFTFESKCKICFPFCTNGKLN